MTEIEATEAKSIRNSLAAYGFVSLVIFLLYTFVVTLGIVMFLSTVSSGFFEPITEWTLQSIFEWVSKFVTKSLFLLVILYIYTIVAWVYIYYTTIKIVFYGNIEKPRSLGWYEGSWLMLISLFFIPAILLVQNLPFRANNVPYKLELTIRL